MKKQISEAGLFILGIIIDKPTTPYMLDKIINVKRKRNVKLGIPWQTIYGMIYKFKRDGLISRKKVKNRNLPDKTVYSITAKGKRLFKQSLIDYVCKPPELVSELVLPIMLIKYLDKETALKTLNEYKNKLSKEIAIGKKIKSTSKEMNESFTGRLFVEHTLGTLTANRKIVKKLIKTIEAEPRWSDSSVPWWRSEAEG